MPTNQPEDITPSASTDGKKVLTAAALDSLMHRPSPPDAKTPFKKPYLNTEPQKEALPVWNATDLANVSIEAEEILNCNVYKKLIAKLNQACSKQEGRRVVNFVTREESPDFVEVIVKSAFPPGDGQVYMPDGQYACIDGADYKDVPDPSEVLRDKLFGDVAVWSARDWIAQEQLALKAQSATGGMEGTVLSDILNKLYMNALQEKKYVPKSTAGSLPANTPGITLVSNKPNFISEDPNASEYTSYKDFDAKHRDTMTKPGSEATTEMSKDDISDLRREIWDFSGNAPGSDPKKPMSGGSSLLTAVAEIKDQNGKPIDRLDIAKPLRNTLINIDMLRKNIAQQVRFIAKLRSARFKHPDPLHYTNVKTDIDRREVVTNEITKLKLLRARLAEQEETLQSLTGFRTKHMTGHSDQPLRRGGFFEPTQSDDFDFLKSIESIKFYISNFWKLSNNVRDSFDKLIPSYVESAFNRKRDYMIGVINNENNEYKKTVSSPTATAKAKQDAAEMIKENNVKITTLKETPAPKPGTDDFAKDAYTILSKEITGTLDSFCESAEQWMAEHSYDGASMGNLYSAIKKCVEYIQSKSDPKSPYKYNNLFTINEHVIKGFKPVETAKPSVGFSAKNIKAPAPQPVDPNQPLAFLQSNLRPLWTSIKEIETSAKDISPNVMIVTNIDEEGCPFVNVEASESHDVSGAKKDDGGRTQAKNFVFKNGAAFVNMLGEQSAKDKTILMVTKHKISFPGMSENMIEYIDMSSPEYLVDSQAAKTIIDRLVVPHYRNIVDGVKGVVDIPFLCKRNIANMLIGNYFTKAKTIMLNAFENMKRDGQISSRAGAAITRNSLAQAATEWLTKVKPMLAAMSPENEVKMKQEAEKVLGTFMLDKKYADLFMSYASSGKNLVEDIQKNLIPSEFQVKEGSLVINGSQLVRMVRKVCNKTIRDDFHGALVLKNNSMKHEHYFAEKHPEFDDPEYVKGNSARSQSTTFQLMDALKTWGKALINAKTILERAENEYDNVDKDPKLTDIEKVQKKSALRPRVDLLQQRYEEIKSRNAGEKTIIILSGDASAGKSSFAQALADLLDVDYGVLDLRLCRGGLVGQTESRTSAVMSYVARMHDVVLLLDEFDEMVKTSGGGDEKSGTDSAQTNEILTNLNDNASVYARNNVWLILTTNYLDSIRDQIKNRANTVVATPVQSEEGFTYTLSNMMEKMFAENVASSFDVLDESDRAREKVKFQRWSEAWKKIGKEGYAMMAKGFVDKFQEMKKSGSPGMSPLPFPQRNLLAWVVNFIENVTAYEASKEIRSIWFADSTKKEEMIKAGTYPGNDDGFDFVKEFPAYCDDSPGGKTIPKMPPPQLGFPPTPEMGYRAAYLSSATRISKIDPRTHQQTEGTNIVLGTKALRTEMQSKFLADDQAKYGSPVAGKPQQQTLFGPKAPAPQPGQATQQTPPAAPPAMKQPKADDVFDIDGDGTGKTASHYYYSVLKKAGVKATK